MAKISEQSRNDRKEIINNAAVSIIAKKGYSNATMQDIANEANLAVGTLYNYYKNKEDLIYSMFADKWNEYRDGLEKCSQDITDFDKQFRNRFNYSINFFSNNPDYVRIMFTHMTSFILGEEKLRDKLIQIREMIIQDIANEIQSGREKGNLFFTGNEITIANLIFGSFQSFFLHKIILSEEVKHNDIETLYTFIYNGLKQNF